MLLLMAITSTLDLLHFPVFFLYFLPPVVEFKIYVGVRYLEGL